MRARIVPREDRRPPPGTRAQRRRHAPLEIKVRYWMLMLAFLITSAGIGVAVRNTAKIASLSTRVAVDEHNICVIQTRGLPAATVRLICSEPTRPLRPHAP